MFNNVYNDLSGFLERKFNLYCNSDKYDSYDDTDYEVEYDDELRVKTISEYNVVWDLVSSILTFVKSLLTKLLM
jgi:hypothetical protein